MSNSIDVSGICNQIEELESKACEIESAANDASRAACDAKSECDSAEEHADRCESIADDLQRELQNVRDEIESLETDDSDELAELKRNNELLENALKFERAKFARIVQFVQAIADETITLDDSETSESESS